MPKNADPYITYGIIDALRKDCYVDEPYTNETISEVVDQYLDALEFDNAVIGKDIEEEPTAIVYERFYRDKFRIRGRNLENIVMPYMRDIRNRDVYSYRINCIDVRDPIEKAVDFIEGMKRSIRRKRNSEYWENAEMIYKEGKLRSRDGMSEEEQESDIEQEQPDSEKQEDTSVKTAKTKSKHDEYVENLLKENKEQEDAERKIEKPSAKKQRKAKKEQIRKKVESIDFDINL